MDTIEVEIVPEKKGYFLKHVEYAVTSKRFVSEVFRRYTDFLALYKLLLCRFPYRLVPKLPPKKIVGGDSQFLEDRRRGLCRWLVFLSKHPVISNDALYHFFMTQNIPDFYLKVQEVFKNVPDEFTTSDTAEKAKESAATIAPNEFATNREQIRMIYDCVNRIKQIGDSFAIRSRGYASDMADLGSKLSEMSYFDFGGETQWKSKVDGSWAETRKAFEIISKEFMLLSNKAINHAVREENEVSEKICLLIDVLSGHQDLCNRVEKGVSSDHQNALSKMLALKKRQIHGVLKGTDAESVAALENRMLQQESVIASVESRTAFSLCCVRDETKLVHNYLELLGEVLNNLVSMQISAHSQLAEVWMLIRPTVLKFLPDKNN